MSEPAVDLTHLNRYTGGEQSLNGEILRLFDHQCTEILAKLEELVGQGGGDNPAKAWRDTAHSLKGAARGIGAFSLAETAAEAEKISPSDRSAALAALEGLKSKAATVHGFIDELLGASD